MFNILLVALGSGLGGVLRYLCSLWFHNPLCSLPLGTLVANFLGCLLIGVFTALSQRGAIDSSARLLLVSGFCGGLTTFSTFVNENLQLLSSGQFARFAAYLVLSLVLGLALVAFGCKIGAFSSAG